MLRDPTLFRNRYRIASARHPWWDYGLPGWYFITICTRDRTHYLGEITNGRMRLSPMGRIVRRCWYDIPRHFPHASLDAFVVMPNHIHGIIVINEPDPVETQNFASLQNAGHADITGNIFGPQSRNLPSMIRGFKIGTTKWAKLNGIQSLWQPRYHDRIIRDADELERIRWYIRNNPRMWGRDRNNR